MRFPSVFLRLVFVLTLCLLSFAQSGRLPRTSPGEPPPFPGPSSPTPEDSDVRKRAARERSKERYAQLKRDTDQLLTLATELKKSVDASHEQTLSLEVIHKAEQIEKLAKSVRQKMAGD